MRHSSVNPTDATGTGAKRRIVLAGNPNSGKSAVFNALTGLYVDVSNYPGTTLDITQSQIEQGLLIDTPGVYGISSFNDEERIARDIILGADVVINVVSSLYLERDLFLTQQIIDAEIPIVVALNMVDEAERHGIHIDVSKLSEMLGVPVVPTVAVKGKGIDELLNTLPKASVGHRTPDLYALLNPVDQAATSEAVGDAVNLRQDMTVGHRLLILEGDPEIAAREGCPPGTHRETVYRMRREHVNRIASAAVTDQAKPTMAETISNLTIRPITGIPMLIACLWLAYKILGSFVASTVVGFTEETVMLGIYEPFVRSLVSKVVSLDSALGSILAGEFGVLTMTPVYVFGLLTPLVFGFYIFMALFEDSGYLPRIAALSDRTFGAIGLNGKAVIPMILGFGCVTMATITTRMLATKKEKRIAVFLLGLAIPCSAQLGVVSAMMSKIGMTYLAIYVLTIIAVFVITGLVLRFILPGTTSSLLLDLPPLRVPSASNVLRKAFTRTYHFLREATPLFAAGAALIGVMNVTGLLEAVQGAAEPIVVSWLRLPREAATAFVMGFIRRDFGAAGLSDLNLTSIQTVGAMVTITLFVPCLASVLVMIKERGRLEALAMWVGSLSIAIITGGLVVRLLSWV
jgi:ferrous iron transport protein B